MKRICKDCGRTFELSPGEIQFYKEKNLSLPKRCKECRDKKKRKGNIADMPEQPNNAGNLEAAKNGTPANGSQKKPVRILTAVILLIVAIGGIINGDFFKGAKGGSPAEDVSNGYEAGLEYRFRNGSLLTEHFEKHGAEFGFASKEEYEAGANHVISSENALHKLEAEDGDDVYYLEESNEFVIVSTDGYIRTYFKPEDGIDYYNRQ